LNRPITQRAPGNKSATSNISYGANAAGEVKRYDYISNANILLTVSGSGDYLHLESFTAPKPPTRTEKPVLSLLISREGWCAGK
jgi:hypothetical protein